MNVLFISFDFHERNKPIKSVAIATLESYLCNKIDNIQVDSFSFNMNDEYSIMFEQMIELKEKLILDHDYICVSFYAWNIRFLDKLMDLIKIESPKSIIVAGGYEVNSANINRLTKEYTEVNHFVIGYAERSLEKLLIGSDKSRVLNFMVDNQTIPAIYSNSIVEVKESSVVRLESKRGCPGKCTFCAYKNNDHSYITLHNIDKVKRELTFLNKMNVMKVNVLDPIFTIKNFQEVLDYLVEIEFRPILSLQMKFEIFYKQLLKEPGLLKKMSLLNVELEFGLQSINTNVLDSVERINNMEIIRRVIKLLNQNSIKYEVSIIRGLPGETKETFNGIMKFIVEQDCKKFVIYPLTLLSNTKLHGMKDELKIRTYNQNGLDYVIESYSYSYSDYLDMKE